MTNIKNNRDSSLDIAKGIGILLVVLGHTIQTSQIDFDNNLYFRIIYSFHMPLFFFISGALLCIKIDFYNSSVISRIYKSDYLIKEFCYKTKKSFLHLLTPFFSWTLILYFAGKWHEKITFQEWIFQVFKFTDYSLWFLPALFYCILFFNLTFTLYQLFRLKLKLLNFILAPQIRPIAFLISSLLLSILISKVLPNFMGLSSFKHYYQYLIIGGIWQIYLRNSRYDLLKLSAVAVFALLISSWHRLEPGPIALILSRYIGLSYAIYIYNFTVAVAGIFTVFKIVENIQKFGNKPLIKLLTFCGIMSLGIYAFHFQFLEIRPYFFSSVVISLALCIVINKIPVVRTLLIGSS